MSISFVDFLNAKKHTHTQSFHVFPLPNTTLSVNMSKSRNVVFFATNLRKVYPKAPCFIDTPSGAHDKHNLRGKSVLAALKASGAPNPLELRCLAHDHGILSFFRGGKGFPRSPSWAINSMVF